MDDKLKAEYKDKILDYLMIQKQPVDHLNIWYGVFENKFTENHTRLLLEEMQYSHPRILDYDFENQTWPYVERNDFTQEFVDTGGFKSLYENQSKTNIENSLFRAIEEKNVLLEHEIKKQTKRLNNQKLKTHWIPILISFVALGWSIFKSSPQPKQKDQQIKQIQQRLDYIEGTLIKQNDSLRNEIHEVNLLIDAHELKSDT